MFLSLIGFIFIFCAFPTASHSGDYEKFLHSIDVYRDLKYHAPVSVLNDYNSSTDKYYAIRSVKIAAYYEAVDELNARITKLITEEISEEAGAKWYSTLEGHTMGMITKVNEMQNFVDDPLISTVCETGFNAGYSLLNFLIANPTVSVVSFDLSYHQYTPYAIRALQSMFPERSITVITGDSSLTIPSYIKLLQTASRASGNGSSSIQLPLCDLIFIDGGHSAHVLRQDMINMQRLANLVEKERGENKLVDTILENTFKPIATQIERTNWSAVVLNTPVLEAMNSPSVRQSPDTAPDGLAPPVRFTNVLIIDDLADSGCTPREGLEESVQAQAERCALRAIFDEFVAAGHVQLLRQVPVYPTPCITWLQDFEDTPGPSGETVRRYLSRFSFSVADTELCMKSWDGERPPYHIGWFVAARFI